ncbi:ATP-dependent endonuclease [Chryseobacterium pennae]|uniref:ATP-dependent endonuclease n=1 Tax=Chryseobacterium pennae TaxID=2258962 RepID=A0A3D9C7C2_9FLAO|nr:AAA family ATPase [Chryseobacterium pennae]REC61466.1 ATP-dependent endonuclease [Chryseobacterium pennae]
MFLRNIKLWNFRKFGTDGTYDPTIPNLDLNFTQGLNLLIGENDSGKTAIMDAIKLVLKTHSYEWIKVEIEDFNKNSSKFRIELLFESLSDDEAKHFTEWLSWKGEGATAEPTLKIIYEVKRIDNKIIPSDIKAGPNEGNVLTSEAKEFLKVTYLKPLRDAKSELIPKKNSRLSQIFQEHEAFKGQGDTHLLVELFKQFNVDIKKYFEGKDKTDRVLPDNQQKGKKLKSEIDKYLKSFYDRSKETDIKVVEANLKNILEKLELLIKDEQNIGLGTLNRLFMASELLHLNKDNYDGLRLGLIEELEAHLHPQAQMQVIKSLQEQENIQLILTTHSPNLASKVKLENIILCNNNNSFPLGINYTKLEREDYIFLERFLDTTKSNLFFAKGLILVEGWSEELLIPPLARLLKRKNIIEKDLTEAGVSVINVGNTALHNYSKIFLRNETPYMNIQIAIVTDTDVRFYKKNPMQNNEGNLVKDSNGKVIYNYEKENIREIAPAVRNKIADIKTKFDEQTVKSFPAKYWTLEFCLHKSDSLGEFFREITKEIHSGSNWTNFEEELSKKLINRTLDKVEISYRLAEKIDNIDDINFNANDTINYLINAIKYACNC